MSLMELVSLTVIDEVNVVPFIITPRVPPSDAETVPVNEIEKVS